MKTPVAIVGGGPGGSSLAMFLARRGIRSTIVEAERFPRYHIGESMTGECGGVVRALGIEEDMLAQRHPVKWAVHVFGNSRWSVPVMQRTPTGELQATFTWQVRRSEFDQMMLDKALAAGTELVQGRALTPLLDDDGAARGLRVELPGGKIHEIESEVVVDVSGQSRWLCNSGAGLTSPFELGHYDKQVAVFSQLRNAIRNEGDRPYDTLIFYKQLVHWAWFIPIDDEVTSIGVVSPGRYFASRRETKEEFLLRELQELHPELKRRVPDTTLVEDVRAIQNYSYQVRDFTGKGWLCIGDSHRFIDPIFSFGLYVTMKEAQFAAPAIEAYLAGTGRDQADPFAAHRELCERGLEKYQDLIDSFWSQPLAFALLVHQRHPQASIDLFAGRVYDDIPNPAWDGMRQIKRHARSWWSGTTNWWESQPVAG
jgi:flavin-dependent dehydrogenase